MSLLNIETRRLVLRPFLLSDVAVAVELMRDPDVIRFMGGSEISRDEAAEAIRTHTAQYYEGRGMGALAGVLRTTNEVVGRYSLQVVEIDGVEEVEVNYLTSSAYRRRGLASEAVEGLLDAAWREGMVRIIATIQPHNLASLRLAEGLGFRYEKDIEREGFAMRLYAVGASGPVGGAG